MPHKSAHPHGGGKDKHEPKHSDRKKEEKDVEVASEKMSQEFPSYDALDERRPGSLRGEHRVDPSRMRKALRGSGGVSAKRSSEDDETGLSRGESVGAHDDEFEQDLPARGESVGDYELSGSLWDEAEPAGRGESGPRDSDLTWSGFARPARGESSGQVTEETGRADRTGAPSRGESTGQESTAHGGFIEPDERTSGSSRRH